MVSFSPEDVVFVMNKWDSLCMEKDTKIERFQINIMETIRNCWREVDDSCVLKLSVNNCFFSSWFCFITNNSGFIGIFKLSYFLEVVAGVLL